MKNKKNNQNAPIILGADFVSLYEKEVERQKAIRNNPEIKKLVELFSQDEIDIEEILQIKPKK